MNLFISQIIGFCAFLIFIISIQQVNKKKILFLQIFSFGMYALEYLVINAYSGMIIFIINIIRSIVFYKIADKNSNNKLILMFFIVLSLLCGKMTYKYVFDILPIIASILTIFFTWQSSTKILRLGQICVCICWIIYDIFVSAYIGILTEFLIILFTIFALLRLNYNYDFEKIIFKYYIKIVLKANEEDINFSNSLPKIKFLTNYKYFKNRV